MIQRNAYLIIHFLQSKKNQKELTDRQLHFFYNNASGQVNQLFLLKLKQHEAMMGS